MSPDLLVIEQEIVYCILETCHSNLAINTRLRNKDITLITICIDKTHDNCNKLITNRL
jgi:hypothetical protein